MTTSIQTFLGGLKLAGCWASGMAVATLADVLPPPIGHDTHITLGAACGVGVACLMAAMWLSRRLTQLQDGQKTLKEGQEELKGAFKNLPCHRWDELAKPCEPPKPKEHHGNDKDRT